MATDFVVEHCRTCNRPVIWAVTERARTMPVDALPVKDGDIQLVQGDAGLPTARVLKVAERFGKKNLRTSHFATCPQAERWRSARPGHV
jgi:hypothetical protein